jgi:FAD/FMN-containing dehydrogenase
MTTDNPISKATAFDSSALECLASDIAGQVVAPGDSSYDEARTVWNGVIDRRPAVIVRALNTGDVKAAIALAGDQGLPVAVRAGGHNVAGSAVADGALVVDLSGMRGVEVDAGARTVRVQGGAQIGDVDDATQKHDLAVPFGVFPETGVAGLTLRGGHGWLRRH